ncbi:unnamed protein product [Closterium sp. Naga37s-1]|nr:unnamed protein product [Closterium sp. Naga37s-1]
MADLRASNHETVTCERVVRIVTQAENAAAAAQAPHVTQCSARAENAPVFELSQVTQLPFSQRSSQSERFQSLRVSLTASAHVVPPTTASACVPSAAPAPAAAAVTAAPASFLCLLEKRQKCHSKHSPSVAPLQPQAVQPAGLVRAPDCALAEDAGEHAHSAEELGERAQLAEGQLDLAELQARVVGSQLQLLRGLLAEREEQVRVVMAELAGMRARVVRARNVAEQSPRGICRSRSSAQGRCAGGSAADTEETTGAGKTGFAAGGSVCGRKEAAENAGIARNRGTQGTRNCYTGRASFSVPASMVTSRRASTDRRPAEAIQALAESHAAAAAASAAAAGATGAGGGGGEASACASECLEAAAVLQQVEMSVASTEAWLWEVEAAAAEARDVFLQAEEETAAAAAAVGAARAAGGGEAAVGGKRGGRAIHSGGFRHELALSEKAFTEELYRRLAQLQADLIEAGEGERVLQGILQGLEGSKGTVGKLLLTGMDGCGGWDGGDGRNGGDGRDGDDGRENGMEEDYEEALILQQALEYLKQQQVPAVAC